MVALNPAEAGIAVSIDSRGQKMLSICTIYPGNAAAGLTTILGRFKTECTNGNDEIREKSFRDVNSKDLRTSKVANIFTLPQIIIDSSLSSSSSCVCSSKGIPNSASFFEKTPDGNPEMYSVDRVQRRMQKLLKKSGILMIPHPVEFSHRFVTKEEYASKKIDEPF